MARDDGQAFVPVTRTEWANHRLRQAILSGELVPGEKLVATSLAKTWDISPTPLRDAFVRLAASGLVELTPQRGARVAPISVDEAAEIFEVRLLLEPAAFERSLAHSDDEHVAEVEQVLADLEEALKNDDEERITITHRRFHAALLDRTPGVWLTRFCATLSEHSGRYQMLSPVQDQQTELKMQQHEQLVRALRERNAEVGIAVLRQHLTQSLERIHQWAQVIEDVDASGESDRKATTAPGADA